MPFFHVSAWANKGALLVLFIAAACTAHTAAVPSFQVDPATVTAGRTLSILCPSKKSLKKARVRVGEIETRFYKLPRGAWIARVGIPAAEPPGPHTVLFSFTGNPDTFQPGIEFMVQAGSFPVSRIKLAPAKNDLFANGAVERDVERMASFYKAPGFPKKLWDGTFLWPAPGIVTSPFGARRSYGKGPPTGSHSGVDLANSTGTVVIASAHGHVVLAEWLESFGNVVLLDHGQGIFTYYLHMQSGAVKAGQTVQRGDPIGLMGQEGIATGPHVHWSLAVAGVRVDPMEWAEREIP